MSAAAPLPGRLDEIVEAFTDLPRDVKLELLLDYANRLPPLPERYAANRDSLERVHECQTPFFVATEVEDGHVRLHFDAPDESPTTRGFAGILHAGLDGEPPDDVLAVPADFSARLGLNEAVSPLRLRGIAAILGVVQRQVRTQTRQSPVSTQH
ncbi:MAG: SufE family protein [Acidobacteriota bacterium]|nr:SufE family protein [Acidobacteriota bacterium]